MKRRECHRVSSQLVPFLRGALTPRLHERVQAHIRTCAHCQSEMRRIEPVVRMLSDKPEIGPPTTVSPGFNERLEHVIQAEIVRQSHRRRGWLQGIWSLRSMNRRLAAAALATIVVVGMCLMVLPLRADTLSDALRAIASCESVHVWGNSNAFSLRKAEPFELWWAGDQRCWLRIGLHEFVLDGRTMWRKLPEQEKFIALEGPLRPDLIELTSPRKYLEHLAKSKRGGARFRSTVSGNFETITVEGQRRRDSIRVNRETKLLESVETHIEGKDWYRVLERFVYNEPPPKSVEEKFQSVTQDAQPQAN